MKKIFFALATIGLLAACNGQKAEKSTTSDEVIISATPENTVNIQDSLIIVSGKGAVVERRYSGILPAADGPGIVYNLTMFFQQDSEDGVYQLETTYIEAENGEDKSFMAYGKRKVLRGIPSDPNAIVYELIPNNNEEVTYFLLTDDDTRLTMLDQNKNKIDSDLNYTLQLLQFE